MFHTMTQAPSRSDTFTCLYNKWSTPQGWERRYQLGPQEGNFQLSGLAIIFWHMNEHLTPSALVIWDLGKVHWCSVELYTWKQCCECRKWWGPFAEGSALFSENLCYLFQPIFFICSFVSYVDSHSSLNLMQAREKTPTSSGSLHESQVWRGEWHTDNYSGRVDYNAGFIGATT